LTMIVLSQVSKVNPHTSLGARLRAGSHVPLYSKNTSGGSKAPVGFIAFTARLKSCPDTSCSPECVFPKFAEPRSNSRSPSFAAEIDECSPCPIHFRTVLSQSGWNILTRCRIGRDSIAPWAFADPAMRALCFDLDAKTRVLHETRYTVVPRRRRPSRMGCTRRYMAAKG